MFLRKTIAALFAVAICGVALAHVKLENPVEGDFFKSGEKIVIRWTESVDHGESATIHSTVEVTGKW